MDKRWYTYIIIAVLAVTLFFLKRCGCNRQRASTSRQDRSADVNRDRGLDRRVSYIEYTQHAKCRMQCRHITQEEVQQIMRDGKINYNKTDLNSRPCPAYAVEGVTSDKQRVRIVFGQCNEKTNVITVIDLDTEWSCDCPGDDDKYKNRN